MSAADGPASSVPDSVRLAVQKARSERLLRLDATLEQRLVNPLAAIEVLVTEMGDGNAHAEVWERLHGAAVRDGLEAETADAYLKCASSPRLRRLAPEGQAVVLMHAADFLEGVRGDGAAAEPLLERVIALAPGEVDAVHRLERRLERLLGPVRLLELYALIAADPPRQRSVLATQVHHRLMQLAAREGAISDDACRKLLVLVAENPRLLDALEAHCRKTKRAALACALMESVLADGVLPEELAMQRRLRLVELYFGEAQAPAEAIGHVEVLLEHDPTSSAAVRFAEKLLSTREVASRAAAALKNARSARSVPPPSAG